MTMISNKDESIYFSHAEAIHENKIEKNLHTTFTYTPELPTIICSNKKDAEEMQQQINAFVRDFSQKLLNKEK